MNVQYYRIEHNTDKSDWSIWGLNNDGKERCFNTSNEVLKRFWSWYNPEAEGVFSVTKTWPTKTITKISEEDAFLEVI